MTVVDHVFETPDEGVPETETVNPKSKIQNSQTGVLN
jgi:hypothetical protein